MIRVRFLTTASGPGLQHSVGDIVDVPEDFAKELLDAGYAERVEVPKAAVQHPPAPAYETATLRAPEKAVVVPPRSTTAQSSPVQVPHASEAPSTPDPHQAPAAKPDVELDDDKPGEDDDDDSEPDPGDEALGKAAAEAGEARTANPYNGRTRQGRAWSRGWDSAQPPA